MKDQAEIDGSACLTWALRGFGSLKEGAEGKRGIWGKDKARNLAGRQMHAGFRLVCCLEASGACALSDKKASSNFCVRRSR